MPLQCSPYLSSFHPLSQLKMQRRNSRSSPPESHSPVERPEPSPEPSNGPTPNAVTRTTNNNADARSPSAQPQRAEAMDGIGPDLIPRPTKIQQLRSGITFWALMVPYTAFVSQYVYQVLISDHPHVGRLFLSPADTNLLITVLSQLFALLIQALFKNIFDVLRWQLASRERGIPIPTFLQLSGATKWLGVLALIAIKGNHHIWGLQR
jgi:hypothetical protein